MKKYILKHWFNDTLNDIPAHPATKTKTLGNGVWSIDYTPERRPVYQEADTLKDIPVTWGYCDPGSLGSLIDEWRYEFNTFEDAEKYLLSNTQTVKEKLNGEDVYIRGGTMTFKIVEEDTIPDHFVDLIEDLRANPANSGSREERYNKQFANFLEKWVVDKDSPTSDELAEAWEDGYCRALVEAEIYIRSQK